MPSQNPNLFLLLLLLLVATTAISISSTTISTSSTSISYSSYCRGVPASDLDGKSSGDPLPSFQISTGYFSGAEHLFGPDPSFSPRHLAFLPITVNRTRLPGVLSIAGTLTLSGGRDRRLYLRGRNLSEAFFAGGRGRLHRVRPRLPRLIGRRASATFELSGFWSESDGGKLCMVGHGSGRSMEGTPLHLSAVLKLHYPKSRHLSTSFVTGSLESASGPGEFNPIALVAYPEDDYTYDVAPVVRSKGSCPREAGDGARRMFQVFNAGFSCSDLKFWLNTGFRLEYGRKSSLGFNESFMSVNQIHCSDDGNVRAYMVFANRTRPSFHYFSVGDEALVAEGFWDKERNRLCLTACRVLSSSSSRANLSVGECSLGASFWFPSTWSIWRRSFAAGLIWAVKPESEAGKSGMVSAWSSGAFGVDLAGVKYNYTKVDDAKKYCLKGGLKNKGKDRYPDSNSYGDFAFQFFLKEAGVGYASPVTIGSMLFDGRSLLAQDPFSKPTLAEMNQSLLNISYDISYTSGNSSLAMSGQQRISAEGIYDTQRGSLCLIGCQEVHGSLDCEVVISVQFAPLNAKTGQHAKGTISSLRKKTDPLHFKTLEIASYGIYVEQAADSIWRMDIESMMVLISLTLCCVFIVLQLFHVKKNPEVLSSISITMLIILSLGYMIPLVLNFEALFFMSRSKQTVAVWRGGWLEVNEVVVRLVTMVAFLLQLRLLQVAWAGRSADETKNSSWDAERKALWICLPLYFIGALITWFVHMRFNQARRLLQVSPSPLKRTFWEDLICYAGLILDGFLLPQVIFNMFSNSKRKALAPSFYVGSAIIRALPHVYDVIRAQSNFPSFRASYIYASPQEDLYNLPWDIIIPCGVILLSVLVCLQQRFGGAFFLCSRSKKSSEYEMVPPVNS